MTHSFRPACNFLFYKDAGQSRTARGAQVKGEMEFCNICNKESMGRAKEKRGDTDRREEEWGSREGGGGAEGGRGRTHVEDITVWVKAQSLFMARFVRGSRCS